MQQSGESDSKNEPAKDADLEFVLVDQPTQRASGDVRRRVRSHVTKLQHQRTREKEIVGHTAASRPFIAYSSQNVKPKAASAKPARVAKAKKSKAAATEQTATGQASSKRRHGTILQIRSPKRIERDEEGNGNDAAVVGQRYWPTFDSLAKSDLGLAFSRGIMSFRTFALDDSTNTVGTSLEALGLDLASVLGCYKLIVQIQARDFEQHYPFVQPDVVVWERFYRFVFTDPVLLTVALLITIRYRLECLGYRNRARDFMQVLQLEEFLIRRVNAALKQPGRAISDPMLVCVALCAAYEVKNGNPDAYNIHMKGLMRMIELRGGLPAIGCADPYLERMLIWHDVNTSEIVGHEGYLVHRPNSLGKDRPKSNLRTFQMPIETDARVTSSETYAGPWVQHDGAAMESAGD